MIYFILFLYISIVFVGSLRGASAGSKTPEGYFLANRGLGTWALFFTILATNFSAFYFLGFAGAGYRIGYAHYVIMSLGTAFAGLSFFLVGTKIWKLGRDLGFITPSELIYHLSGSQLLRWTFALVMILFTFPYLSLQIVGAGYILENITHGAIPYFWGAGLLTIFTIAYVWIGGMASVAKTDLKQGVLMILLMIMAVIVIANNLGGISAAHQAVYDAEPDLFSRQGVGDAYPPAMWFSWLIFWIFCIPMFPQIFMRFYIAKDLENLKKSAILYALVPVFISILPVTVGVLGHLSFPALSGTETDEILPKMLAAHGPDWFTGLVMTGALAAFMSTLDSQLLALSTIVTRDVVLPFKKTMSLSNQVLTGRVWVIVFAIVGLAIAAQPFDTIDDMGRLAFGGLAVLFPSTFMLLHFRRVSPLICFISIVCGEMILVGFYFGYIPSEYTFGFDRSIIAIGFSFFLLLLSNLFSFKRST